MPCFRLLSVVFKRNIMSALEQLKKHTVVVADTGDFNTIHQYKPTDATTNPSLLFAASKLPQYASLVNEALDNAKTVAKNIDEQVELTMDNLYVRFGKEILSIIPGRVSIEVDARLSFDVDAQVAKALKLIGMFAAVGVAKERILIKLSATWEGIQAAHTLETRHGVHCNLTLIFSFCQAVACAAAGVTLISPFVGRIYDWHVARSGPRAAYGSDSGTEDPGVKAVRRVYAYYKRHGIKTQVMGASFRNTGQIKALCGCDLLTISPKLLDDLSHDTSDTGAVLSEEMASFGEDKLTLSESQFRWMLNEDEMATDKLSEGIRKFAADGVALETSLRAMLSAN